MNYSFEYIDIILLAMIAGFIFLRLRGILGKRTGFEGKSSQQFQEILKEVHPDSKFEKKENFDEKAQNEFLKGAKIAYETIITDFSDNDNKLIASKLACNKFVIIITKISDDCLISYLCTFQKFILCFLIKILFFLKFAIWMNFFQNFLKLL